MSANKLTLVLIVSILICTTKVLPQFNFEKTYVSLLSEKVTQVKQTYDRAYFIS